MTTKATRWWRWLRTRLGLTGNPRRDVYDRSIPMDLGYYTQRAAHAPARSRGEAMTPTERTDR